MLILQLVCLSQDPNKIHIFYSHSRLKGIHFSKQDTGLRKSSHIACMNVCKKNERETAAASHLT